MGIVRPMSELSRATVSRLPRYLRLLEDSLGTSDTVSSDALATAAGVNSSNVRRDLSDLGFQGTRGVGYSIPALHDRIRRELGIETRRLVAIVGAGNLGTALAMYNGLSKSGFDVIAVYDNDESRIGQQIGEVTVQHLDDMAIDCEVGCFDMAILAVPSTAAQKVADQLVAGGIRSILNFAPVRVDVPDGVAVRQVDLSTELQILSYYG
jgi:redox-sensing transcriptional repressor